MTPPSLESILGFAAKARKLVVGTAAVEKGIKRRQVDLVIYASDLSPKTIKELQFLCDSNGVKYFCYSLRSELGKVIGAPERGVIGIVSRQFASMLCRLLEDRGDEL